MASVDKRPVRALLWLAVLSGVVGLVGVVGVIWWWGVGFDEAEELGLARSSTDSAMVASFWTAVAGFAGLLVTGLWAAVLYKVRGRG